MIGLLVAVLACSPKPPVEAPPPPQVAAPVTAPAEPPAEAPDRIAASHILVTWQGLPGSQAHRTRDEALARIREVQKRLQQGEDFSTLASTYSDDTTAKRGGFLGAFGHGAMVAPFENAAFALPVNGTSDVVESPFGFHLIRRMPLEEVHIEQILVQWKDIRGARTTRTREEAQAQAQEALALLNAGEPFASVASRYSDGPMASRGGDLGWFTRGQYRPAFEEAAFSLKPGETSPVVETEVGLHVLRRIE